MIEDYYYIENGWFDLFKQRAEDAVSECHRILRSIAGGVMEPPPRSQFGLSVTAFELAHKSLKQVTDFAAIKDTVEGYWGWYMKSWTAAAQRGVQMTMVLVVSREEFKEMLARTHAALHFCGNRILQVIGLDQCSPADAMIDQNIAELYSRGWVSGEERLSITDAGKKYVNRRSYRVGRRRA
jgi:hypothetical protein